MSLLQYFSRVSKPDGVSLPSPLGSLSLSVPTAAIASANAEVRRDGSSWEKTKKRALQYLHS